MINLKRYEEAIQFFDKSIELDSSFSIIYVNKGVCLYCLNKFEESIVCFDRAIELNPNLSTAYNNKANALVNLKDFTKFREKKINFCVFTLQRYFTENKINQLYFCFTSVRFLNSPKRIF